MLPTDEAAGPAGGGASRAETSVQPLPLIAELFPDGSDADELRNAESRTEVIPAVREHLSGDLGAGPGGQRESTAVFGPMMVAQSDPNAPDTAAAARRRRTLRRGGLVAAAVVGVLGLLYGVDLAVSSGDVPRGVTVGGVAIGGMSRSDAEAALRQQLEPRLTKAIPAKAGDVDLTIDPTAAGLTMDWPATLDQAGSQPLNPFTRLTSFFTSREVGVVSHTDTAKLTAALDGLRGKTDRQPVEGTIRFEGSTPKAVDPVPGQTLDAAKAVPVVLDNWASGQTIELPVTATPVKTTKEGVAAALQQIATPAVAGPVVVKGDGKDATLHPAVIANALSFEPTGDGGLTAKVNNAALVEALKPQLASTEKEGKDAQIVFSNGAPTVQESVNGRSVNWDKTLAPVLDVLKKTDQRTINAVYEDKPAKVTTEQANQLGIKEVIGEFQTGNFAPDSGENIRVVAQKVNGAIVKPGETFSLNGFTGPRGKAQGYVEAAIIQDGAPGRAVGGGISQFATTLYNAAYFAGMQDAGHKEHSYYITRYPAGREATVFENPDGTSVIDLKFTNDSPTGVAIQTIWTPSSIKVVLWGTKRYNVESITGPKTNFTEPPTKQGPAENCHPSNGSQGFTVTDTRVVRDLAGNEVKRHTRTVKYNPQPKIVCGGG